MGANNVRKGRSEAIFGGVSDDSMRHLLEELDGIPSFDVRTEGDARIVTVKSESGIGTMTFYEIMPGVMLTFNEFDMSACITGFSNDGNYLSIDHCREGRMERLMLGGTCSYTASGDMKIDDFSNHAGTYVFPTEHYCGISISFDIDVCEGPLSRMLGGFPVSASDMRAKYCRGVPYVLHRFAPAEQVFSDLYEVPADLRKTYAKLRVLELLLMLDRIEYDADNQQRVYFYRSQVEKVKKARDVMCADLTKSFTVEELADRVGLPLTAFKTCFKGVYGMPPYAYLRSYRMEKAAAALRETNRSVASIGANVGYESPSKFTAAFKSVMKETPTAYRRKSS